MTSQAPEITQATLCGHEPEPGRLCILEKDHEGDHDPQPILVSAHQVIQELLGIRSDFVRAAARLEEALENLTSAVGGCIHPVDRRLGQGTFQWPMRFKCRECGETYNGPAIGKKPDKGKASK